MKAPLGKHIIAPEGSSRARRAWAPERRPLFCTVDVAPWRAAARGVVPAAKRKYYIPPDSYHYSGFANRWYTFDYR
jgi:hypothetical protein